MRRRHRAAEVAARLDAIESLIGRIIARLDEQAANACDWCGGTRIIRDVDGTGRVCPVCNGYGRRGGEGSPPPR